MFGLLAFGFGAIYAIGIGGLIVIAAIFSYSTYRVKVEQLRLQHSQGQPEADRPLQAESKPPQ